MKKKFKIEEMRDNIEKQHLKLEKKHKKQWNKCQSLYDKLDELFEKRCRAIDAHEKLLRSLEDKPRAFKFKDWSNSYYSLRLNDLKVKIFESNKEWVEHKDVCYKALVEEHRLSVDTRNLKDVLRYYERLIREEKENQ